MIVCITVSCTRGTVIPEKVRRLTQRWWGTFLILIGPYILDSCPSWLHSATLLEDSGTSESGYMVIFERLRVCTVL